MTRNHYEKVMSALRLPCFKFAVR